MRQVQIASMTVADATYKEDLRYFNGTYMFLLPDKLSSFLLSYVINRDFIVKM